MPLPPARTWLRDIQFRLEYGLLRFVVASVRLLPLETSVRWSASAWRLLAPRISRLRHMRALYNVRVAFPDMPPEERERIVLAHWENLGRVMAETMQLDRILADPNRVVVEDLHIFTRYINKMGPLVGVSLHMGNWELAIWPMTFGGKKPAAVYRSVNNPYVDKYLRDQRANLYPGGLFGRGKVDGDHGDNQRTARMITDFVRRGGHLGMICDLYDRSGIPVPFFGKPARTQAIGAMIARRVGARVWMARCLRIGTESRFRIQLRELRVPRSANQSNDVREMMSDMQKQFEAWIREHPEQWMWSNRRWH
ncbi:MAG: lysophospholipid acyltransferase family protein [Hyphomicrobiaceae bacterium]